MSKAAATIATSTSIAPLIAESERVLAEAIKHFGLSVSPSEIVCTIQTRRRSRYE